GRRDHRVLDPGVDEPVPRNVDEADQHLRFPRDDPAEAVALYLVAPVPLRLVVDARLEGLRVERVHLRVGEVASPDVLDRHDPNVAARGKRLERHAIATRLPWTGGRRPRLS